MLEAPVGIKQLGTHDPHFGPLRVLEHRLDPVRRDHRDVVVEEDDVRGVDDGDRGVVDGRVIERFDAESPVFDPRVHVFPEPGSGLRPLFRPNYR